MFYLIFQYYVRYERMAQACIDFMNVDIMQFRLYARAEKKHANLDYYFCINLRFLLK